MHISYDIRMMVFQIENLYCFGLKISEPHIHQQIKTVTLYFNSEIIFFFYISYISLFVNF